MTNNKEKGRLRLFLKRGRISGRTGTITISRKGIIQDNQGLPTPRGLIQCSESQSVKFQRRLRTNHFSNGQIKQLETLRSAIKTFIAIIIRNRDILQRTAEIYGITRISLSGKANYNHSCIILVARGTRRIQTPGRTLLLGPLWEQSMSSLPLLGGLDPVPSG